MDEVDAAAVQDPLDTPTLTLAAAGPPPAISAEDAATVLRMATDLLWTGTYRSGGLPPPAFSVALRHLDLACSSTHPVLGEEAISELETAAALLEPAVSAAIDPTAYVAALAARRRQLLAGAARMRVEDLHDASRGIGGPSDPDGALAAMDVRLDRLTDAALTLDQMITSKEVELTRKVLAKVDWEDALPTPVRDPGTGGLLTGVADGRSIADWITRAKTAIQLYGAAKKAGSLATKGLPTSSTMAGSTADALELVKWVGDGMISLSGAVAEVGARVLDAGARLATDADRGAALAAQADGCRTVARAIAKSKGITAGLAAVDLARSVAVLCDGAATEDERIDAGVSMATAALKLGEATASWLADPKVSGPKVAAVAGELATPLAAASIAIPAAWWTARSALRLLAATERGAAAGLMMGEFEQLIDGTQTVCDDFDRVRIARLCTAMQTDPEREAAYRAAEQSAVTTLLDGSARELASATRSWRSATLRAGVRLVLEAHPGIGAGTASTEQVGTFVAALTHAVTQMLEDSERIAAMEGGLADAAELRALIGEPSALDAVSPGHSALDVAFAP